MSFKDADSAVCQAKAAYNLHIYPQLSTESAPCCKVTATKDSTSSDVIKDVINTLNLDVSKHYVLVEVKESGGEEWVLDINDSPVHRVLLWPRRAQDEHPQKDGYYFLLQERNTDGTIKYVQMQLLSKETDARRLVERGFLPWHQEDFDDLCNLPSLTETTILENLKCRFLKHKIYTYAGSILIAINPFKFLPIYNPKYVKMYENHQLGKLEPHIFAIADVAYHTMLKKQVNQCIVISGESGSGKTQSTNFLIHCLTALSQKGYASGVERTILGAGPVLEAFGNAKTAHNNNSSRFGKFIQVNYLENGIVRGAVVEKYLLEKSRLVSQEKDERNYHVFYYLLLGVNEEERKEFHLKQPEDYFYLNQHNLKIEDGEDLRHDFERLKQAMEMVGFLSATKKQIFSILSAILYLGNVTYKKKATGRDEGLEVGPPEVLDILSQLLKVKREILVEVLTKRKTVTANDKLILPYSLNEAITARDSMAKSLYSALFDWIVLRINHALLNKKDMEESVTCLSIGVLDIFGFEDFETNSFEQFCINYANEQLQYYFNQHIFKLEQEEYKSEGITWHNIDYTDNVACIHLISKKPTGLFYLLDEESNFPHATNQTLLAKFKQQHEENKFFVGTPVMEPAFIIRHFAGKVKYQIKDFREKNMDYMRPDIVALLRSSDSAYVRELIGMDPVAVFRWAVLRAAIRAMAVFAEAGRQRAQKTAGVVRQGPRVPLGELQRSNTPVEKVYRCSMLDFSFDCSEDFDINAFEDIISFYENKKDMHEQIIASIKGLPWQGDDPCKLLRSLSRLQHRSHFMKSRGVKQKQIIPKNLLDSKSLKLIVSMTLHDRTTKSLLHLHKKKKPPSISAQFQTSLNKLLETLGKAEPFFIRCIRSNAEKKEMLFDESLVLQQLRYTGMLETVRIRRSGYSAKYTFEEFIDQFQVLLPKNAKASKEDICVYLNKLKLDENYYQIGKTKVFMKEAERQILQDTLHKEVIRKIILLQSWLRMVLERRRFLRTRQAAIVLQAYWRSRCVRMALQRNNAAIYIQSAWRRYRERKCYLQQKKRICLLQAMVRGHLQRKRFQKMAIEKQKAEEKQREMQEDQDRENDISKDEHSEPATEQLLVKHKSEVDQAVGDRDQTPNEQAKNMSSSEKATLPQKNMTEGSEKVTNSREKRESRRQRGLEHNELQNKHVLFSFEGPPSACYEEQTSSEEALETVPEPKKSTAQDTVLQGSGEGEKSPSEEKGLSDMSPSSEIKESSFIPEQPPVSEVDDKAVDRMKTQGNQNNQLRGSQSFNCPERPTNLALNLHNTLSATGSFQTPAECWADKTKRLVQKATKDLDSPTSSPIQRYVDDPGKLKYKREKWKGKRQSDAGQNDMLSQSLDERTRADKSPQDQLEKKGNSLSDLSTLAQSVAMNQQSPDATEEEKGNKKYPVQKKPSDLLPTSDAVVSMQPASQQIDAKSAFKSPLRRLLGKKPDKKIPKESPDVIDEDGLSLVSCVLFPETGGTLKVSEASSGQPSRLQAGERHVKESSKTKKNRTIKISKISSVSQNWRASMVREIANANELKHLDEFLLNKINDLRSQKSGVECLFFEATEKFRGNIKTMYSAPNGQIHVGYKDLVENYQLLVTNLAKKREEKEVKLVLNLFQSLLDEFIRGYTKKEESEQPKQTKAQKKKRKQDRAIEEHNGHVFTNYQVSIRQSCEHCSSYIWPMEKACLCSVCKLTCHKKCMSKIQSSCTSCGKKNEQDAEPRHFGVCVSSLTSEKNSVPVVMEKLLEYVEMHGLYTEGIYRKSGSANRMKELKQLLQADPNSVKLENYPIHTITGILKQWLRELPDPLMTSAQYNDFLRAVELPEKQEQLCAIYSVLEQLPQANHNTLERLIFHLVKVALIEDVNRMSPNALAIVFAPCLLRCPDTSDPLTSMKDVSKTTMCVEMLIKEQIRKYKIKMDEINQLEAAESIAFRRLSLLRQNTLWPVKLGFSSPYEGMLSKSSQVKGNDSGNSELDSLHEEEEVSEADNREKEILIDRIQSIKEEKEDITYRLPELDQRGSDEENVDSETSASTESLLEDRTGRMDTEAIIGLHCRAQSSSMPAKDIFKVPSLLQTSSNSSSASLASRHRSSLTLSRIKVPRRTPVMPTANIKLPPGIFKCTESQGKISANEESQIMVRRREQPARRTDKIHSVYIAQGSAMAHAQELLDEYEPTAKVKRRFSDPYSHIPCIEK
ncbi:unconventional myosin-IXb isoform X1 [Aquila chrysaetos chrysaetos]|uniref:unconventional myosin-IXb isoform X1 n=1 Tax=Aquila chrysaetos chrysaetos TaxID=223781 RepID=UPI001176CEBF|nr:unconventional myosin-IXb isoform X1 [Aquila chrysaetos chrysaetos]XP_029888195.1 unconventional myosin-IXb isoform X1 [Aquila chrysaetos chrysaetos]XP_029888196.1 unconventional myosin-IXb isoform X1 [Aquila chrysaetos chrysaetos]XP_029888197.1 unconventional myosin-IXb isoform X1 [Aquila chrysaetos chrysaetos]XP_029888198.1 unconventional myosin-IXb isoform X1 [Aquila chrysaetos chrysaetos]XP_040983817.1 unconventional myosin-IXb isoform X1 [Aquila chrysaetos chrysaetos]